MNITGSTGSASRHLRLISKNVNSAYLPSSPSFQTVYNIVLSSRKLSSVKGSGLRRIQQRGRVNRNQTTQQSQSSLPKNVLDGGSAPAATEAPSFQRVDPHSIANEMIHSSGAEGRTPGTQSIASLTHEQKMSNYAMATGLLAFVSYIFYYSLASVGGGENARNLLTGGSGIVKENEGANPGFEEFLKEANEGRSEEEKRLEAENAADREARDLVDMENTTTARLKAEGVEDLIVAASANEQEEREMEKAAGFEKQGDTPECRPLWKRVVFFWRHH